MNSLRSNALPVAVAVASAIASAPAAAQVPVTLAVPGRTNDAVSLAADGSFVAATWGAGLSGVQDVFVAVSRDGGATFSAPTRVNATVGDARVGGEQPPHVVIVPRPRRDPALVVVWTAKRAEGGRLLTARSDDGGKSFGATNVVPGTEAAGSRGWESVAVDASGKVYVMWLDHRGLVPMAHQHVAGSAPAPAMPKPDPVEQAGKSQLYVASLDGSVTPRPVTNSVCYCCKTSLAAGPDGSVYGVWRHVYPGDLRDMALTVSRDRGRTFSAPVRVSEDGWEFDGCPDNGPAIAVDATKRVHVAWPSPADVKDVRSMALWYAISADGRTFTPRVRIPAGLNAGHVQILAERGGSVLVAWEEMAGGTRTVRRARGTPDAAGRINFRDVGAPIGGKYPSLALSNGAVLAAYTVAQAGGNVIAVSRLAR